MKLEVNGEAKEFEPGKQPSTLSELIDSLGLDAMMVVAEVNGDVVRRADFRARGLVDGDKVELVRFVGGG